jgi:hypothetical protein
VAQSGQKLDDKGEKMEKTKKKERNHFVIERIEMEGIH